MIKIMIMIKIIMIMIQWDLDIMSSDITDIQQNGQDVYIIKRTFEWYFNLGVNKNVACSLIFFLYMLVLNYQFSLCFLQLFSSSKQEQQCFFH